MRAGGQRVNWSGGEHDIPFSKKAAAESFTPPPAVAAAAARGLALRQSASPSNKGGLTVSQAHQQGIGSGVQRAVDLKNRRALSAQTVRRMHAFFSRHEKNKAVDPGKTPAQDKGHQAWLLWGGDPGKSWAGRIVAQMKKRAGGDMLRNERRKRILEKVAGLRESPGN
jgi:hypothetical protein